MKKLLLASFAALYHLLAIAQTTGEDGEMKDTVKASTSWYSSPWVWVVVAALFILLLVILTPGNKRSK